MRWALVILVGCGQSSPAVIDAAPHVITTDQRITLGGIVECTLDGGTGDSVRIVLSCDAPFDWNFHTHVGGTEVLASDAQVMAADYTYVPTERSSWNLTILNDNASAPISVHLELSLYGNMQWSGF